MTFQQLTYLIEISKCGSINKAAQHLFLSQSGISTSIHDLEEELGITFFERTNRGVVFTAEGKEFLSYANSLLEQKQWIEDLYKNKDSDDTGTVSLSIASLRYPFTDAAFIEYIKTRMGKRFRYLLKEEEVDTLIEDVATHHADIGILFLTGYPNHIVRHMIISRKLEIHKLCEARPSVYVRKGHPLTRSKEVDASELPKFPYLAFEHEQSLAADFLEEYQTPDMKHNRQYISISERLLNYQVLRETDCYTTGSGLLLPNQASDGILSIPIKGEPPLELCWISPPVNQLPETVWDFLEILKKKLTESLEYTEMLREKYLE
ncbi:MAG: LysR family transcriptional regulator [Eubacteriales bacterium]|nr:LysR family transcriptional regulator [Eubacteriales bacterium]